MTLRALRQWLSRLLHRPPALLVLHVYPVADPDQDPMDFVRVRNPENTDLEDLFCTSATATTLSRLSPSNLPDRWFAVARGVLVGKN